MIEDEVGHITWVKDRLDRYAAGKGGNVVAETMRRFTEVDERVYEAAMRYRDNARELLDPSLRNNLQSDVRRIVAKTLGVSDDVILETSSLRDLGVSSLDLVVLVMSIEEKFRIEFDPSDLERLRTFGDLARRVGELKGER
jgi:acyl carrier protein